MDYFETSFRQKGRRYFTVLEPEILKIDLKFTGLWSDRKYMFNLFSLMRVLLVAFLIVGCSKQNVELSGFFFSEKNNEKIIIMGPEKIVAKEYSELTISLKFKISNPEEESRIKIDFGGLNALFETPLPDGRFHVIIPGNSSSSDFEFKRSLTGLAPNSIESEFDILITGSDEKGNDSLLHRSKVKIDRAPVAIENLKLNLLDPTVVVQSLNNIYDISGRCSKPGLEIHLKKDLGNILSDPDLSFGSSSLVNRRCIDPEFRLNSIDVSGLNEGLNAVYLTATDSMGNEFKTQSFNIKVDRLPPALNDFKLSANFFGGIYWHNDSLKTPYITELSPWPASRFYNDSDIPMNAVDAGTSWDRLTKKIYISSTSTTTSALGSKLFNSLNSSYLSTEQNGQLARSLANENQYYMILELIDEAGNSSVLAKNFSVDLEPPSFNLKILKVINSRSLMGPFEWSVSSTDIASTWIKLGTSSDADDILGWYQITPTNTSALDRRYTIDLSQAPAAFSKLPNGSSYYWSLKVKDRANNQTEISSLTPVLIGVSQHAYVKGFNIEEDDLFGGAVSIDRDTMVVGVRKEDSSTQIVCNILSFSDLPGLSIACDNNSLANSGAVYVYRRDSSTEAWEFEAYLKAPNPMANDEFGYSVAISGDRIVVSAPGVDDASTGVYVGIIPPRISGSNNGAVYSFTRTSGQWAFESYIKSDLHNGDDRFGEATKLEGNYLLVGQPQSGTNKGRAILFEFVNGVWIVAQSFVPPGGSNNRSFGSAVSFTTSGDPVQNIRVLIGAPMDDSDFNTPLSEPFIDNQDSTNSGAAYLWERKVGSSNFNFESMIKAPNNGPGDKFGSSVAISENIIAIGAPYEDSDQKGIFNSSTLADNNSMSDSGAVYIFSYDGTALSFTHYLKANTVFDRDHFGFPLALAGRTLLVGTPDLDDTRNYIDNSIYYEDAGQNCPSSSFYCNSGGAIIYEVDASEIRHVALIRPSNNENNFSNSLLGSAISIDDFGNIVLGASQEHNSSQAVLNLESAPVTNILPSKFFGAVYIYKK